MTSYTSPSSAEPNVPAWEEDANSPLSINGSNSGTYTLNGSYDAVKVIVVSGSAFAQVHLQVNGDTGANYSYTELDGNRVFGDNSIGAIIDPRNARGTELTLAGEWGGEFTVNVEGMDTGSGDPVGGLNNNIVPPLDKFTLFYPDGTTTFDLTAKVYGLNK